ncbi:hypothetical protein D3C87_162100 [compost metagenome]
MNKKTVGFHLKERRLLLLASVFSFLTLGCGSVTKSNENPRYPAQQRSPQAPRVYQSALSCSEGAAQEKVKPSALTGFLVGARSSLSSQSPEQPLIRPFFSDGCSSSPDKLPGSNDEEGWVECCIKHDTVYWLGGTEKEKEQADADLEQCMAAKDYPKMGKVYKAFVGQFGGPDSTNSYRWGYGWNYKRPYGAITPEEESQVVAMYGVGRDQIYQTLYGFEAPLMKMCDSRDPVFAGFSSEEKAAYKYLNTHLNSPSVIEWARWKNFDLKKREFEIKINSCSIPLILNFERSSDKIQGLSNSCE